MEAVLSAAYFALLHLTGVIGLEPEMLGACLVPPMVQPCDHGTRKEIDEHALIKGVPQT